MSRCPNPDCGYSKPQTVGAQIEGRGAGQTFAIRECTNCGALWGDEREFHGVIEE